MSHAAVATANALPAPLRLASVPQDTMDMLQAHFLKHPGSQDDINLELMSSCEERLTQLVELAQCHQRSSMLAQFALSRRTQDLIDEASRFFSDAVAKLQLGLAVSSMGVNLRIDENVSLLLR